MLKDNSMLVPIILICGAGILGILQRGADRHNADTRLAALEARANSLESVLLVVHADSTARVIDSLDVALRNVEVQLRVVAMMSLEHLGSVQDLREMINLARYGPQYDAGPPRN